MINTAELVRVGMDMDERLPGMIGRDQSVAVCGRLAEPRADGKNQVGLADALLQLGVRPVAELAGIDLARVADGVLTSERSRDGNPVTEGEVREMVRSARTLVGAADDGHG